MAEQKEKKRVNSRSKGRGFEQQIARVSVDISPIRQIATVRDALATRIQDPAHGCVVLLTTPLDGGQLAWHIGTVFVYRGDVWVLHNSHAMGSASLNRLRDFAWRGQRIEGFYKWK